MAGPAIGIDVGTNSVGLASIILDDSGTPTAIHRAAVFIHDNGKDTMASGQTSAVSRKASGGVARRVRRLYRNRRRRNLKLELKLEELGYPIVPNEELEIWEAWQARQTLLSEHLVDSNQRRRLISIAIRHMANHRGWANAWVPLDSYLWKEEPSSEFEQAVKAIVESGRFPGVESDALVFQADIAELGFSYDERMRPRQPSNPSSDAVPLAQGNLLGTQRRADVAREWETYLRRSTSPDGEFESLARIAFSQEKPYVPLENVGKDWLPGFTHLNRASIATLEHQEFQIRQTVANLAIREGRNRRKLTTAEQGLIVDTLMGILDKDKAPTWGDIAENALGIEARTLVTADPEQSVGAVAPIMRSMATVHKGLPKGHPVRTWWDGATKPQRSEFIQWFADPTKVKGQDKRDLIFGLLFEDLDEKESEKALSLKFPSGRSAHSIEALIKMNREMEATGDGDAIVREEAIQIVLDSNKVFSRMEIVSDKSISALFDI